jgi:hypothetical protein
MSFWAQKGEKVLNLSFTKFLSSNTVERGKSESGGYMYTNEKVFMFTCLQFLLRSKFFSAKTIFVKKKYQIFKKIDVLSFLDYLNCFSFKTTGSFGYTP